MYIPWIHLWLLVLSALFICSPSRARQSASPVPPPQLPTAAVATGNKPPLVAVAAAVGAALARAGSKSVVVFDFCNTDGELSALGEKLADRFSAALQIAQPELVTEDRSDLSGKIVQAGFSPEFVHVAQYDSTFARALGASAFVEARLFTREHFVVVMLKAEDASSFKTLATATFVAPLSPDDEESLSRTIAPAPLPPYAEDSPDTNPKCRRCRPPHYPRADLKPRIQGMVVLDVIVTPQGRVADIRVVKSLPGGLTESSIRAVRDWKLRPAEDPDGKAVAVRAAVEC